MPGRVARHHVREEIQRRILSGETRAGERLSQQSLARELGVAQGTVRESLFELQWLGLVESVDHLGVFVGDLDVARILQAYQVREFLEGLAARLCCSSVGSPILRCCGRWLRTSISSQKRITKRKWAGWIESFIFISQSYPAIVSCCVWPRRIACWA